MLLDLMDSLRCPEPHEQSALVLTVEARRAGHVLEGRLGCPVCRAEYPVRDAVAEFAEAMGTRHRADTGGAGAGGIAAGRDALIRLAAQLDLRTPGGLVLLAGRYTGLAGDLADLCSVHCLTVNAAFDFHPGVSSLGLGDRLPLAAGALRAAAVDDQHPDQRVLNAVPGALRDGGRLVAPSDSPLPVGVREIARDTTEWVGVAAPQALSLTPLRRG